MPNKRKNTVERGAFVQDNNKQKSKAKAADKTFTKAKLAIDTENAKLAAAAKDKASAKKSQAVTQSSPLIKVEFASDAKRIILIAALASIAIVAALYVAGLMFYNSLLTNLSFVFAVIAAVVLFLAYRKVDRSGTNLTPEQIDAKVEAYKDDLIETFIGYDVAYSKQDILDAADKYRVRLENGNRANSDIDMNSVTSIASAMIKDGKTSREIRKEQKQQRKNFKKEEKKDKKLFSK